LNCAKYSPQILEEQSWNRKRVIHKFNSTGDIIITESVLQWKIISSKCRER